MNTKEKSVKQAILAVSFGTAHAGTRVRTIEAIEEELRTAFPECPVYRAWTSDKLIGQVRSEGYEIDTVEEALNRMERDGIKRVVVQPTHVLDAKEHKKMKLVAFSNMRRFEYMAFGAPLLRNHEEELHQIVQAVMEEFPQLPEDTALVFMGHGTSLDDRGVYHALDMCFKKHGYARVFVGVMGEPHACEILKNRVKECGCKKVMLAPFLIAAGKHASRDLAGVHDNSWKVQFLMGGFDVTCLMKGLGEYPSIRKIFVEHAKMRMIHM